VSQNADSHSWRVNQPIKILEAVAEFKQHILNHIKNKEISTGNLIHLNYCQGILIEESCSAHICANHIVQNMKANIALGGDGSGSTVINFNQIENSK